MPKVLGTGSKKERNTVRVYKFSPSSDFHFMEVGCVFSFTDGRAGNKKFHMVGRDILYIYARRWTRWDDLKLRAAGKLAAYNGKAE